MRLKANVEIDKKYIVLKWIGGGGMADVYSVRDMATNSVYALKYLESPVENLARRFAREARLTAAIDHPNVIQIFAYGDDEGSPYAVMPLAKHSLVAELEGLSSDEAAALAVFKDICQGIQAIHNSGSVHRDIKPDNVLRLADDGIAVSDLGLARLHARDTTTLTQANQFLGTRIYCAPEQLLPEGSRDADKRTDVYQLGKTLYQMLTNTPPALIESEMVSAPLAQIIRKATREIPQERYQTIAEMLDAISLYEASQDPDADPIVAVELLAQQIVSRAKSGEYKRKEIVHFLSLLNAQSNLDGDSFLTLWDNVPSEVLPIIATNFSDELNPVLVLYLNKLDDGLAERGWSYAEHVASQMKAIADSSPDAKVISMAIEATLRAASHMNRFAAMDSFNHMIRRIRNGAVAAEVADMLIRNMTDYRGLAENVPSAELHSLIRQVRMKAIVNDEDE